MVATGGWGGGYPRCNRTPVSRDGDGLHEAATQAEEPPKRAAVADGRVEGDCATLGITTEHNSGGVPTQEMHLAIQNGMEAAGLRLELCLRSARRQHGMGHARGKQGRPCSYAEVD